MRIVATSLLLFTLFSSFGPSTIKSTLTIPPHEQFYLGGGQDFSFEASAKNAGLVPVTILLLLPDNTEKELIVLKPGESLTAEELRAWLGERTAKFWLPERWAFITEVPKTSVGKFDKKMLRQQFDDYAAQGQKA
jgi:hypothetical protein